MYFQLTAGKVRQVYGHFELALLACDAANLPPMDADTKLDAHLQRTPETVPYDMLFVLLPKGGAPELETAPLPVRPALGSYDPDEVPF
jgi:hypothetical protein